MKNLLLFVFASILFVACGKDDNDLLHCSCYGGGVSVESHPTDTCKCIEGFHFMGSIIANTCQQPQQRFQGACLDPEDYQMMFYTKDCPCSGLSRTDSTMILINNEYGRVSVGSKLGELEVSSWHPDNKSYYNKRNDGDEFGIYGVSTFQHVSGSEYFDCEYLTDLTSRVDVHGKFTEENNQIAHATMYWWLGSSGTRFIDSCDIIVRKL